MQKTLTLKLNVNTGYKWSDEKRDRHFNLVTLLNEYANCKGRLKFYEEARSTGRSEVHLTIDEINWAVVVFTDVLHLTGGSVSSVDLYQLLQKYLLEPEMRKRINKIVKGNEL